MIEYPQSPKRVRMDWFRIRQEKDDICLLFLARRLSLTSQYNAKIKRKRRVAKLRRKKDKVHATIEKAKNK